MNSAHEICYLLLCCCRWNDIRNNDAKKKKMKRKDGQRILLLQTTATIGPIRMLITEDELNDHKQYMSIV